MTSHLAAPALAAISDSQGWKQVGELGLAFATAAMVWMTAAIGMACGAGLVLLAVLATAAHFVVALAYPALAGALPRSRSWASTSCSRAAATRAARRRRPPARAR